VIRKNLPDRVRVKTVIILGPDTDPFLEDLIQDAIVASLRKHPEYLGKHVRFQILLVPDDELEDLFINTWKPKK